MVTKINSNSDRVMSFYRQDPIKEEGLFLANSFLLRDSQKVEEQKEVPEEQKMEIDQTQEDRVEKQRAKNEEIARNIKAMFPNRYESKEGSPAKPVTYDPFKVRTLHQQYIDHSIKQMKQQNDVNNKDKQSKWLNDILEKSVNHNQVQTVHSGNSRFSLGDFSTQQSIKTSLVFLIERFRCLIKQFYKCYEVCEAQ